VIRPQAGRRPIDDEYLATFLALAPGRDIDPLLERTQLAIADLRGCSGAAGGLPGAAGVFVRLTAQSAPDLLRARRCLFDAARHELLPRAGQK
jgi:urease accessory protein